MTEKCVLSPRDVSGLGRLTSGVFVLLVTLEILSALQERGIDFTEATKRPEDAILEAIPPNVKQADRKRKLAVSPYRSGDFMHIRK